MYLDGQSRASTWRPWWSTQAGLRAGRPSRAPSGSANCSSRTRPTGRASARCGCLAVRDRSRARGGDAAAAGRLRRPRSSPRPSSGCATSATSTIDASRRRMPRRSQRPVGARGGSGPSWRGKGVERSSRRRGAGDRMRRSGSRAATEGADALEQTGAEALRRAVRGRPAGGRAAAGRLSGRRGYDWDTIGRDDADAACRGRRAAERSGGARVLQPFLDTSLRPNVNSPLCDDRSTTVLRDLAFWLYMAL